MHSGNSTLVVLAIPICFGFLSGSLGGLAVRPTVSDPLVATEIPIRVSPALFDLGILESSDRAIADFKLLNPTREDWMLVSVQPGCGCTSVTDSAAAGSIIPAGDSVNVKLAFESPGSRRGERVVETKFVIREVGTSIEHTLRASLSASWQSEEFNVFPPRIVYRASSSEKRKTLHVEVSLPLATEQSLPVALSISNEGNAEIIVPSDAFSQTDQWERQSFGGSRLGMLSLDVDLSEAEANLSPGVHLVRLLLDHSEPVLRMGSVSLLVQR